MFKGSDGSSVHNSVLLEQEDENRQRQIKKNEKKAHISPAERLEGERKSETPGHLLSQRREWRLQLKRYWERGFVSHFLRMKLRKVKVHTAPSGVSVGFSFWVFYSEKKKRLHPVQAAPWPIESLKCSEFRNNRTDLLSENFCKIGYGFKKPWWSKGFGQNSVSAALLTASWKILDNDWR